MEVDVQGNNGSVRVNHEYSLFSVVWCLFRMWEPFSLTSVGPRTSAGTERRVRHQKVGMSRGRKEKGLST